MALEVLKAYGFPAAYYLILYQRSAVRASRWPRSFLTPGRSFAL